MCLDSSTVISKSSNLTRDKKLVFLFCIFNHLRVGQYKEKSFFFSFSLLGLTNSVIKNKNSLLFVLENFHKNTKPQKTDNQNENAMN